MFGTSFDKKDVADRRVCRAAADMQICGACNDEIKFILLVKCLAVLAARRKKHKLHVIFHEDGDIVHSVDPFFVSGERQLCQEFFCREFHSPQDSLRSEQTQLHSVG